MIYSVLYILRFEVDRSLFSYLRLASSLARRCAFPSLHIAERSMILVVKLTSGEEFQLEYYT